MQMIRDFRDRIAWVHLRSVKLTPNGFVEAPHELGDTNLLEVMRTLKEVGFRGDVRSDHGLQYQGVRDFGPTDGYYFQDRVLRGTSYLYGIASALS